MGSPELDIPDTSLLGAQLTRRAESEELFALLGKLEPFTALEPVSIPAEEGKPDPRVILGRDRDLARNCRILRPLVDESENFLPELTSRLPELAEPITGVVTEGVHWNTPTKPQNEYHFFSFCFNEEVRDRLGDEQADIWHEMDEMAGADTDDDQYALEWSPYIPRMLVLMVGRELDYSTIARFDSFLRKNGSIEVTLRPMGEPLQS